MTSLEENAPEESQEQQPASIPNEMAPETIELLIEGARQTSRGSVLPLAPLWVIGSPRSGTTWFGRLLDSNPALFVTEETRVMSFINRVVNRLAQDRWLLQRGHKAMIRRLGADLPGLVERFYADLGARPDQRWGDKHPHYADLRRDPECLDLIETLFPDSQYIHLVRDGRSVAASFHGLGWGNIEYSAEVWVNHVTHARSFGRTLPPERFLEVRYEDLVADTRAGAQQVFDFLGIPWHERVDGFLEGEAKKAWSSPTTDHAQLGQTTWVEKLSPENLEAVLSIQTPTLIEFGYLEPGTATPVSPVQPDPAADNLEEPPTVSVDDPVEEGTAAGEPDPVAGSYPKVPIETRVGFLIGGMARSGTTLVQRLAAEIEGVWVPPETHFWRHAAAMARQFPFPLSKADARRALAWYASRESSIDLDLDPDELAYQVGEPAYLWQLFTAVMEALSPDDASLIGEKTPDHLRWAPRLLASLPHLKLVGVVRDPRAVYASQQSVPWGIRDPWVFAEKWLELSRTLDDLAHLYPDRTRVLRYEDVATDPESARTSLAAFLGRPASIRDLGDGVRGEYALYPDSEVWKSNTMGEVRPPAERWRDEVDAETLAVIEWRCEGEMRRWGYSVEVSGTAPPPQGLDHILSNRSVGLEAQTAPLPITHLDMPEWEQSSVRSAARWQNRAKALTDEAKRLREWVEAEKTNGAEWKAQARHLASIDAQLVTRLSREESRAERLQASSDAWKARAEELNEAGKQLDVTNKRLALEVRKAEVAAASAELQWLKAERRQRVTTGEMKRLRARRWWRLGSALSRWIKRPWRIDDLARAGMVLVRRQPLPARPDLADLDRRIEIRSKKAATPISLPIGDAKKALTEGRYEDALAALETDPRSAETLEGRLLARDVHLKLGELSAALADVQAALRIKDDPRLREQARILVGRLRETEPWWLPDCGGPRPDFQPVEGKVLHVLKESLPFFERGYTMRSHTTLVAQRMAGYEPVVATSLGFPRDQGIAEFPPIDVVDGIPHHRLDLGPEYVSTRVPYDLRLSDHASMLIAVAEQEKPALVQAGSGYRGYETALVGLSVARALGVPMIYEIRSFLEQTWTGELHRSESGEYYLRRFAQEVRCLTEADHVITIAESMRNEIIERGVPAEKIDVVPNVVDVDRFTPRQKRPDLEQRYGLSGRFVLGYISNLGWREGIDNLVRAVGILKAKGLDVAGLVVGDGPEREMLDGLVAELGLEGDFVLTGHVPNTEIEDHYALIDLFVIPRVDDRAARLVTPLKPLEAMSMGLPVIAADLPALRELAEPGVRGMVFRPSDPAALAEVAGTLIADTSLRQQIAAAGRAWVLSDRTLESNARRYEAILGKVLS